MPDQLPARNSGIGIVTLGRSQSATKCQCGSEASLTRLAATAAEMASES